MIEATAEQLAVFIQEYIRREQQPDGAVLAVIAADLRDSQWPPHHVAELLLSRPDIQAAVKAAKAFYKPSDIASITQDTILADTEAVFQRAKDDRQYGAALQAKKLQAEMRGFLKKEIDVTVKHVMSMSDADLEKIARQGVIEGEFKEVPSGIEIVGQHNPV